ncbi:hypothetical protein STSP2_03185 [Anaerohalosphaera lusitana]|uniref:Uncharacterized protein n=1 Tax=Anaerohalosphaera lusitana TaxID=1936003 RepID=A0A1U9NQG5_9BACT|nr:hypothetical protein [Anaerohalosphaera lusitana]AQT69984.1 hypothetical protein STSP2_03185 [Anaerohalosphaera lusitana]
MTALNGRSILLFAFVFMFCGSGFCDVVESEGNRGGWVRVYSNGNFSDRNPRIIMAEDGGLYLVVSESKWTGNSLTYNGLWIWKLDANGQREWVKEITGPEIEHVRSWDSDVVCPEKERVIVASSGSETWMIGFDEAGESKIIGRVGEAGNSYAMRSMAKLKGGYLISGQKMGDEVDAWVTKIDETGKTLWEKTYDRGKEEFAWSMAVGEDGSFVIAVDSGEYDKFGAGPSEALLIKCDKDGKILKEVNFKGRHAAVGMSSTGDYAVCHNRGQFMNFKMRVRGYDSDLNLKWDDVELYDGMGLGMYLMADGGDGFAVAGTKLGGGCWVWMVGSAGEIVESRKIADGPAGVDSFVGSGDGYLMASSVSIERASAGEGAVGPLRILVEDEEDLVVAKIVGF